ncbi:tyrosine-type recombinase/integrase [Qipengyuania proteolytica]|uniref:tyrosine-type recombinase/integrase n=1 Tax=Qipengyuania proteolytica TaxID=2867239 RepID=UPI003CD0D0CB
MLEAAPLGEFLRAKDDYMGGPIVKLAMQPSPHMFLRPGELRQAHWEEVNWEEAHWTIPGNRTKLRRPHTVPLSSQALAMLCELEQHSGGFELMFPGQRSHRRLMRKLAREREGMMLITAWQVSEHERACIPVAYVTDCGNHWERSGLEGILRCSHLRFWRPRWCPQFFEPDWGRLILADLESSLQMAQFLDCCAVVSLFDLSCIWGMAVLSVASQIVSERTAALRPNLGHLGAR